MDCADSVDFFGKKSIFTILIHSIYKYVKFFHLLVPSLIFCSPVFKEGLQRAVTSLVYPDVFASWFVGLFAFRSIGSGIISLIIFSVCLSLIYKKVTGLCPVTLQKVFISSGSVLVDSFGLLYRASCHVDRDMLPSSFIYPCICSCYWPNYDFQYHTEYKFKKKKVL